MLVLDLQAKQIFNYIAAEDSKGLLNFLKHSQRHNLIEMRDSLGFSVLSYACYKNETNCFKVLLRYGQKFEQDEYKIKEWVDSKN